MESDWPPGPGESSAAMQGLLCRNCAVNVAKGVLGTSARGAFKLELTDA